MVYNKKQLTSEWTTAPNLWHIVAYSLWRMAIFIDFVTNNEQIVATMIDVL